MRWYRIRLAILAVLGLIVSSQQAQAATVFEQLPGANSGGSFTSSSLDFVGGPVGLRSADDFQLSATALVTDVHWWGGSNVNTAAQGGGDSFTFTFYANGSGAPGTELLTTTGSLSKVAVNVGSPLDPIFFYSSDLATSFPAVTGTTYWVSVFNAAPDASWAWLGANDVGNGGVQTSNATPLAWDSATGNLAFQLTSSAAVPEPATLTLVGLGIAALLLTRRRR